MYDMNEITLTVDPHLNEGDTTFHSITKALDSIDSSFDGKVVISIAPGVYEERVEIWRSNVHLVGKGRFASDTVITMSYGAFDIMEDGSKRGTFRSYTMLIAASDVSLDHLSVENNSGEPLKRGQAIALYADGDNIRVTDCRLIGRQDTLFTGPLPPKEIQPGGFIGPLQNAPRVNGHQYYKQCFISGDVDFIFGSASATFDDCYIESVCHVPSKKETDTIQGYVTAPSTPEGQEEGYVFLHCSFICRGLMPRTVYLSRPWRNFAQAHFEDCMIGEHIRDEGFHDWNKTEARETVKYTVKNCYRPAGEPFRALAPFAENL